MCPGREVTLELSMTSKVVCGLGRCLQQGRGERGREGDGGGRGEAGMEEKGGVGVGSEQVAKVALSEQWSSN